MYQKVFSTLGCAELDLTDALELAASFHLDGIELRTAAGRLDLPAYLRETYGNPENLKTWLKTQPMKICALGTSLKLMGSTDADRRAMLEFVPWAETLGIPYLRIFDGGDVHSLIDWGEAVDTFNWWSAVRRQHAWSAELMVETHDSLLTSSSITELTSRIPTAKILWDSHHTWKKGGEAPLATWRAIRNFVVHIHVKDSVPASGGGITPFQYVEPGQGTFPMQELKTELAASYLGPVSLEWERYWIKTLAPLQKALNSAETTNWW